MKSRLTALNYETMSSAQREVLESILKGPRGNLDGPFLAWIHAPELADRAQQLGAYCRYRTCLPLPLSELAILTTAVLWQSQAEWQIHAPIGIKAGLDPALLEQLRCGETPEFIDSDQRLIHTLTTQLYQHKRLPKALYQQGVNAFGEVGMVELIGLLGYYALVAMTLNAFEVERDTDEPRPFSEPLV